MAHTPAVLKGLVLFVAVANAVRNFQGDLALEEDQAAQSVNATGLCHPFQDPPCNNCKTNATEKMCRRTLEGKIMEKFNEQKANIEAEANYLPDDLAKTKTMWQHSVACRLAGHAGLFTMSKVGCSVTASIAATPACVAAGIPTGGLGGVACYGAIWGVCNIAAAVGQKVLITKKKMQPACNALNFRNPVPPEHQYF
mmetsp:Transcript_31236/g.71081  ORF Transcript_31236/g.71081 Transcript_31236/m.71081 type:complete len:197 (-) Transcript_31236:30-620(-)